MNDYISGVQQQPPLERLASEPRANGLGIASLILGVAGFLPIPGLTASILAVILGFLAGKDSPSAGGRSRVATAGIVLGFVGIAMAAAISIVYFWILGYPLPQIHRYHPEG